MGGKWDALWHHTGGASARTRNAISDFITMRIAENYRPSCCLHEWLPFSSKRTLITKVLVPSFRKYTKSVIAITDNIGTIRLSTLSMRH